MKIYKIKYLLLAAVFLVVATESCKKADFDINQEINVPTDSTVTYDVILPAALDATGRIVANDWGWLQNWMGFWARSGTYAPNVSEETYALTFNTGFGTTLWNDLYGNLYNYQVIQNKARQAGALYYEGIARLMKAHDYQILVDVFNNVPYSQALKGSGNVTPKYDKGIDVYKDLLVQIDTAKAQIARATGSQGKDIATFDIMFQGDKAKWAKFANTLKLRLLVHLMNGVETPTLVGGIDVVGQLTALYADPDGFLITDASVQPGYQVNKPSPYWSTYFQDATSTAVANNQYYRANSYSTEYYQYNGDPRTARFYTVAPGNVYKGVAYGLPSLTTNAYAQLSGIGTGLLKAATQPQWIITATESLFLQAEVMERLTPGSAGLALDAAVLESFNFVGPYPLQYKTSVFPDAPTAATFYQTNNAGYPDVDYTAGPLAAGLPGGGLYTILQQKWFALNGIAPFELWTDYRRTDIAYGKAGQFPAPAPYVGDGPPISVSPANTATKIPTRLLYPQTEYNYNAANVLAEGNIERYGKIFWDLQ